MKILLGCAALFSVAQLCSAAACTSGTLASYLSLGTTGCTVGSETFSGFSLLSLQLGASQIAASSVNINPTGATYGSLLTFSTAQTAAANSLLESIFTYKVTDGALVSAALGLSGASETKDGGVTAIENYCAGGSFNTTGLTGCSGTAGSLLTLDGVQNTDQGSLGSVSFVNITDDFTVSGGVMGSATGGTFTNSLASAVPEPASILFAGLGLAFAAGAGLRKRRCFSGIK